MKAVYIMMALLLSCLPFLVSGQSIVGYPEVASYLVQDHNGEPQCFDITQGRDKRIYAANNGGVLVYDGIRWELIELPNAEIVTHVNESPDGTFYVGANSDFGYLEANERGQLEYHSLVHLVDSTMRDFKVVGGIAYLKDTTFFFTSRYLFELYDNQVFKISDLQDYWHYEPQTKESTIYFIDAGQVFELDSDGIRVSPDFPDHLYYTKLAASDSGWVIGTKSDKVYTLNHNKGLREIDLPQVDLVRISRITGNQFIIGTVNHGVIAIDADGNFLFNINEQDGMADNLCYTASGSYDGTIWVATNSGISKISANQHITYYKQRNHKGSMVTHIDRFNDDIYAGANISIQKLVTTPTGGYFEEPTPSPYTFFMQAFDKEILVSNANGISQLKGNKTIPIENLRTGGRWPVRSSVDPNIVFLGSGEGLLAYRWTNGQFQSLGNILSINSELRTLAEDSLGNLWIATQNEGVIKFEPNYQDLRKSKSRLYGLEGGLGVLNENEVFKINDGRILFGSRAGIYEYSPESDRFQPMCDWGEIFCKGDHWFYRIGYNEQQNSIWLTSLDTRRVFRVNLDHDPPKVENLPYQNLEGYVHVWVHAEPDNITWFGGPYGVIRYDGNKENEVPTPSPALAINHFRVRDSVLHFGAYEGQIKLDQSMRDVRFEVSAQYYESSAKNQYQYRLIGLDDHWSGWTYEPFAIYANLKGGDYRFEARAKNAYEKISETRSFDFLIEKEWQETMAAKVGAGMLFLGLLLGSIKYVISRKESIKNKREAEIQKAIVKEQEKGLEAVFNATEEERRRIAKDLHDGVGQQLSALKRSFEEFSSDLDDDHVRKASQLKGQLDEVAQETRTISHQMMPRSLIELGLVPAIEDTLNKSLGSTNIEFEFEHYNLKERYDERKEVTIYRILQELVNNIIKHSGANMVSIQLFENKAHLIMIVEDNGSGVGKKSRDGIGFINIKNRLNPFEGRFKLVSEKQGGTLATISIPV